MRTEEFAAVLICIQAAIRRTIDMAKLALYVQLTSKPGKEKDVEALLQKGAEMAAGEKGTIAWFGFKDSDTSYGIFDTFDDEAAREAHLHGPIAAALMAKADELLASPPKIFKIEMIAEKK
jgi:quinol monooxygenase YgiN